MKIAVAYEDGNVFQHFGHTPYFKVYDVENGVVTGSRIADTNGNGHGALAGVLQELQADILICGGIGGGARQALSEAGIEIYGGVSGSADEAAEAFLKGALSYNPDAVCNHHGEHHGKHQEGGCKEQSCGHHS